MKILYILNPRAGKMRGKTFLFDVLNVFCRAGHIVTVRITTEAGQAKSFAADSKGYDMIVCNGGDGTLNEVISGIMESESKIPLGYIPSGSTNDFARTMNIKSDPKVAAESIVSGNKTDIDIGLVNGKRHFCYIASFGVFTAVSYNTPQNIKNTFGHLAYVMEGMRDLIGNFKTYHVSAEANGEKYEGDYVFGAVTNSTSVGGIVNIGNEIVDLSDGLFEVILIKNPKNVDEFARVINGLATSNFTDSVFDFFKASDIKLSVKEEVSWSLDGEEYNPGKEVTVKNLNNAITFIN